MPSSPLMSAANRINLDGVPQWQPDDQALACPLCDRRFTLFFRRHHCRRCGRVVCGSCSAVKTTYLPSSYVVCPPSQIFLETPHIPHRTCDECVEELEMIRSALRAHIPSSTSSRSGGATRAAQGEVSSSAQSQRAAPIVAPSSRRLHRSSSSSSIIRAPVTSSNNRSATISAQREHHEHQLSDSYSHNQNSLLPALPAGAGPSSSSSAGPSSSPQPVSCGHKRIFQVESTTVAVEDGEDDNDGDSIVGPSSAGQRTMDLSPVPETPRSHRDSTSSATTLTSASGTPQTSSRRRQRHSSNAALLSTPVAEIDEENRCPVCNRRFDPLLTEADRETHITECLKEAEFSGSPEQTHRANRMIVYKLSAQEAKALGECVICFEDFVEGDSVGRLECLCVYHEKCILDWFSRKGAGECPVHAVHM